MFPRGNVAKNTPALADMRDLPVVEAHGWRAGSVGGDRIVCKHN
jgi:hypothetical protein